MQVQIEPQHPAWASNGVEGLRIRDEDKDAEPTLLEEACARVAACLAGCDQLAVGTLLCDPRARLAAVKSISNALINVLAAHDWSGQPVLSPHVLRRCLGTRALALVRDVLDAMDVLGENILPRHMQVELTPPELRLAVAALRVRRHRSLYFFSATVHLLPRLMTVRPAWDPCAGDSSICAAPSTG